MVEGAIRFGFAGIKNVGEGADRGHPRCSSARRRGGRALREPVRLRRARIDGRKVNRRVVESLVKCGAFDSCTTNRAAVWAGAGRRARESGAASQRDREIGQESLFGGAIGRRRLRRRPRLPEAPAWTDRERLEHEKEVLGFYVTGHPLGGGRERPRPARPIHRRPAAPPPRARRGARSGSAACSRACARPAPGKRPA